METTYLMPDQVPARLRGDYSGHKFKVRISERQALRSTYWDGGSRSTWSMVELSTGRVTQPNGITSPKEYGGTLEGREVEIPPGFVLREHSIFCGKDMGLTFYARAEDIAPLLPKPVELTNAERVVLAATKSLKNTYGGRTNLRFTESREATGITAEFWEAASQSLKSRGMLDGRGSITVAGKNAIGDWRLPSKYSKVQLTF